MIKLYNNISNKTELLQSPFNIWMRLYLFNVFFFSGWQKIKSWDTTLMLFEYEYNVPLLSPEIAAYLATGSELFLPILLLLGFFTKASALGLFVVNAIAVISYGDISPAGEMQHYWWGTLMGFLIIYGGQKYSIDNYLKNKNRE